MGWLIDLFTGGAAGGLLGLLGSVVTGVLEFKNRKLKAVTDLKMRELDLKELETEITHAEKLAVIGAQRDIELSADRSFQASQHGDDTITIELAKLGPITRGIMTMAEAFRRVTRPGITWASSAATVWLFTELGVGIADLTHEEKAELLKTIVVAVVTVASTSTTWWFGQRYMRPKFGGGSDKG